MKLYEYFILETDNGYELKYIDSPETEIEIDQNPEINIEYTLHAISEEDATEQFNAYLNDIGIGDCIVY
tara:strand:- start:9 stop:215 length:207 start_codon:yes stop_codon:yes gene_type:complete